MVFHKDLEANQFVIPCSRLPHAHGRAEQRLNALFDGGEYDDGARCRPCRRTR